VAFHGSAAVGRDIEIVKLLLDKGADPNADMYRKTILHSVTDDNHIEVMRLLIARGADVDKRLFGETLTPLMTAAGGGQVEAVRLLLASKADVTTKNTPRGLGLISGMIGEKGKTALAMARDGQRSARTAPKKEAYRQIIELLQAAGANE